MKLEELLGADLYAQVQAKLDEVNSKEPDKLKHVRYADLSEGNYVSKEKYTDLETSLTGKQGELDQANALIADLKKNAGKDTDLQNKINDYEAQVASLQAENARLKAENALKFALVEAGAQDIDYVFYKAAEKLKADGKTLELDESEHVKGADDLIKALKTQLPNQFIAGSEGDGNSKKVVKPNNLPGGDGGQTVTLDQFRKMGYQERLNLKKTNPEQFNQFMGK